MGYLDKDMVKYKQQANQFHNNLKLSKISLVKLNHLIKEIRSGNKN